MRPVWRSSLKRGAENDGGSEYEGALLLTALLYGRFLPRRGVVVGEPVPAPAQKRVL